MRTITQEQFNFLWLQSIAMIAPLNIGSPEQMNQIFKQAKDEVCEEYRVVGAV